MATGGRMPWQTVLAQKRARRAELLKPWLISDASEDQIAGITDVEDAVHLAEQVAAGKWTAESVVRAYAHKAAKAHDMTNCLTEVCFDEAFSQAKELDEHLLKTGKPVGPLHGVVFTLKDQFDVKGLDTTLGYVGRAFAPAKQDAVVVQMIKSMGGIILAKTNLPQSIMWCETENPLWGLTTNPRNPGFTPGGSTGGEGALLALKGSLVGFGTDIGGSIRIPSHIMGLYGLKPSSGRLPYYGVPVSTEGQEHVPSVIGPMARSLASLHLVTKSIIDAQPWGLDAKVVPLPWRQDVYEGIQQRPLVIGLLVDDGVVRVHPPIERVVKDVAQKLSDSGHEVVQWDASGHAECVEIMDLFYTVDGGEDIRREIAAGGEPAIPHVEALLNRAPCISVYEYWQLNKRKLAAQQRQLLKWNTFLAPSGREIDILLSPTMPHVAVPHRTCKWVGYTKVWNFLDYSALTMPAGVVSKDLDPTFKDLPKYTGRCEADAWNWNLYDLESMAGHPVSIQIVSRRLSEEKVLGAAKVIRDVLLSNP